MRYLLWLVLTLGLAACNTLPNRSAQNTDASTKTANKPGDTRTGTTHTTKGNSPAAKSEPSVPAFGDIDEAKEIEIGRQMAAVLLGAKPLHPDMALQRYVNRLGRWISLQSSRPNLPWTFGVIDDRGFNAFAAPGGYVFVTKGLIDRMRDESDLAGVLAHEINHVVLKHHLKALHNAAMIDGGTKILALLVASQVKQDMQGTVYEVTQRLSRNLYTKGLDRDDELEADRHGVTLAARAGFDPYGLLVVLQDLRTVSSNDPVFALTLSTHPSAQTRIDQLELAIGNRFDGFVNPPSMPLARRVGRATNK